MSLSVALGAVGRIAVTSSVVLFVMCLVLCRPDRSDGGGWKSIPYGDHITRNSD